MTKEIITVLDGAVRLRQSEDGFRTCVDSVLLAAACPIKSGQSLLDIGCGVGGAMFCVAQRVADISICGVDVVASVIDLAKENAELNAAAAHCEFECADIRRFRVTDPADRYDHVVCNPPYMEDGKHLRSPKEKKAIAHGNVDQDVSIKDWIIALLII